MLQEMLKRIGLRREVGRGQRKERGMGDCPGQDGINASCLVSKQFSPTGILAMK